MGNRGRTTGVIVFISPAEKSDTSYVKFALKTYGIQALHSVVISPLRSYLI